MLHVNNDLKSPTIFSRICFLNIFRKRNYPLSFKMSFKKTTSLAIILSLTGCNSHIKHLPEISDISVPEKWQTPVEQRPVKETSPEVALKSEVKVKEVIAPKEIKSVENGWLKNFDDIELNKHVSLALKNNPDLLSSAAQLKSAIKQVKITGSSLWPSLSFNFNRSKTTLEGNAVTSFDDGNDLNSDLNSDLDNTLNNTVDPVGDTVGVSTDIRTVRTTLDISWEADVWGRLTQRKKAAAYSAKAQSELFKFAELSLVANVSRAWYNLVTNKLQLDLAYQRLDSFKNTASLIEENYKNGISSALDVYLSRSDVQQQIASLSDARFGYVETLRAFKTLLGQYPDNNLEFNAKLPQLNESVPTGLPAQLLTRRPDIKASQLTYQAQIANAKAAQRDLYPVINFRGSIGDSRDTFNELFDGENLIRTFISDLTAPIFASGSLKSVRDQAVFNAESAYADLLTTTLTAFEEVENSLSRETSLREQKAAIQDAVSLAENALELALDRYKLGIENYNTVLESQRRVFDSKENEINVRNALLQNRIGIHLALGGDFIDEEGRNPAESLPTVAKDNSKK